MLQKKGNVIVLFLALFLLVFCLIQYVSGEEFGLDLPSIEDTNNDLIEENSSEIINSQDASSMDLFDKDNNKNDSQISFSKTDLINDCGNLNAEGIYTLTTNVSSAGTCFTIGSDNVWIDCGSFDNNISYGQNSALDDTYGIYSDGFDNISISNCYIMRENGFGSKQDGIYLLNGEGVNINDVAISTLSSQAYPIRLENFVYGNVSNVSVSATFESVYSFYIDSCDSLNFYDLFGGTTYSFLMANTNNSLITNSTLTYGLVLYGNSNNISNNDFPGASSGGANLVLSFGAFNNSFVNNNISRSVLGYSIYDDKLSTETNYFWYENEYGMVNWTNDSEGGFLSNLTTSDAIGFDMNFSLGNNTVALNTGAFAVDNLINSSAEITFYGTNLTRLDGIKKYNGYSTDPLGIINSGFNCLNSTCFEVSFLDGDFTFNTTSFSSFTGVEDFDPPSFSDQNITDDLLNNYEIYENESVRLNASIIDDVEVDTVYFEVEPFGNLTPSIDGIEYYVICNATNECNTNEAGSYNWTLIWANDTSNNVSNLNPDLQYNVSVRPEIVIELFTPNTNANFTQNDSNEFTINVSCNMNDCGEVNFTLDPAATAVYFGDTDELVHKSDTSGNQVWNVTLGDGTLDVRDLAVDSAGNIYVGFDNDWNQGNITKYDSSGNLLWDLGFESSRLRGIDVDSSNNVYFGIFNNAWPNVMDILKYSPDGVLIWNNSYSGYNLKGIVVDSSDNVYVAASDTVDGIGDLIKLDSSGNYLWNQTVLKSGWASITGLAVDVDSSSNVYFATAEEMGWPRTSTFIKYDSNGNHLWNVTYSSAQGPYVAVDTLDNVYFSYYSNVGAPTSQVIKFDSTGSNTWNYTSNSEVYIYQIDADESIYCAGYNRSEMFATRGFGFVLDSNGNNLWNYTSDDYTGYFNAVAVPKASSKASVMPMNSGTPFWTNVTNPYNITLTNGSSELITWYVNATGTLDSIFEFYVYGNKTDGRSDVGNESDKINITISQAVGPLSINNLTAESYSGIVGTEFVFNGSISNDTDVDSVNLSIQRPDDVEVWQIQLSQTSDTDEFNGTWDSTGNETGVYYIDIYANDSFGNNDDKDNIIGLVIVPLGTTVNTYVNQSLDLTLLVPQTVDVQVLCDLQVDLLSNVNVNNASLFIACFDKSVENATTGFGSKDLSKYFAIIANDDIEDNLQVGTQIRLYYTDAEVTAAGIDESTLRIYRFNETTSEWDKLTGGVNTVLNYVYADVISFSSFGIGGSAPSTAGTTTTTTTTTSAGGGGGGVGTQGAGKVFDVDKGSFNVVLGLDKQKHESFDVIHKGDLSFGVNVKSDLGDHLQIQNEEFTLKPRESQTVGLNFIAGNVVKDVIGKIFVNGEEQKAEIPVDLKVVEGLPLDIFLKLQKNIISIGNSLKLNIKLVPLQDELTNVNLDYIIEDWDGNELYTEKETVDLTQKSEFEKQIKVPDTLKTGKYKLKLITSTNEDKVESVLNFEIEKNLLQGFSIGGITQLHSNYNYYIISTLVFALILGFFIRRKVAKGKGEQYIGSLEEVGTRLKEIFR